MKHFLTAAALSVAVLSMTLIGCVSLGIKPQDGETTYTVAAIAADVFITSGKATGDAVGQICTGDKAAYKILTATRNIADGVNYAPADVAHTNLQADGFKINPQCSF